MTVDEIGTEFEQESAEPKPARSAGDTVFAFAWRTGLPNVFTIAARELSALFVSPVGWVVAAVFALLVSWFGFIGTAISGRQATMEGVFSIITNFLMLVLIPLITMRVFAEERSQGTLEVLLTSPVRDWELAVGKWLGAFVFYVLLLATTLVYIGLLLYYAPVKTMVSVGGSHIPIGSLDFGLIGATYVGLLLVGAAATAIGVLASCLTKSQIVAFFLGLGALLFIWYAGYLLGLFTQPPLSRLFQYIGGFNRYQTFSLGQLTLKDTVYFASLTIGALVLTTRLLESRRWR